MMSMASVYRLCRSLGANGTGHNHPAIRNAVIEAAERAACFGAPTEMEVKMAELVTNPVPTMDMVRMVTPAPKRP